MEKFPFNVREVLYYVGEAALGNQVAEDDLLTPPLRPAWCKDCESVCVVEDIVTVRELENIYGAVRSGTVVEYPISTQYMTPEAAAQEVEPYLRWRMGRRHPARALCCGGVNFQVLDVEQPLFKHEGCEYGFIEGRYSIGGGCGPGPGVRAPANIRLYDTEGELIGNLTWRKYQEDKWDVEPMTYPPVVVE